MYICIICIYTVKPRYLEVVCAALLLLVYICIVIGHTIYHEVEGWNLTDPINPATVSVLGFNDLR
jgi:hypothetical protein